MIVVVWIYKKIIVLRKNISGSDVGRRQPEIFRMNNIEHPLWIVGQISAQLVTEVDIGFSVTDYLYPILTRMAPWSVVSTAL